MGVEVQRIENRKNRIFWCGFGFHQDFCRGTVTRSRTGQTTSWTPWHNYLGHASCIRYGSTRLFIESNE